MLRIAIEQRGVSRAPRLLAATAVAAALAGPALAQDVVSLVTYRADNRAGSAAATGVVAELIAERSDSAAVQRRARSLAPQGSLSVGADELLLDIGAYQLIDRLSGDRPATALSVIRTEPVAVAPAAPAAARSAALPEPVPELTPEPAAAPVVETAAERRAAAQESAGRSWNSGGSGFNTAVNDRGGGGGGSSGGGGSGGGGGGGGGSGGSSSGGGGSGGGGGGGSGGSGGGSSGGGGGGGSAASAGGGGGGAGTF